MTKLVKEGDEEQNQTNFKPNTLAGVKLSSDEPHFVQGKLEKSVMNFLEDEKKPIE